MQFHCIKLTQQSMPHVAHFTSDSGALDLRKLHIAYQLQPRVIPPANDSHWNHFINFSNIHKPLSTATVNFTKMLLYPKLPLATLVLAYRYFPGKGRLSCPLLTKQINPVGIHLHWGVSFFFRKNKDTAAWWELFAYSFQCIIYS